MLRAPRVTDYRLPGCDNTESQFERYSGLPQKGENTVRHSPSEARYNLRSCILLNS